MDKKSPSDSSGVTNNFFFIVLIRAVIVIRTIKKKSKTVADLGEWERGMGGQTLKFFKSAFGANLY